ncbi:MAG: hypothetical protein QXV69_09165 [Sulfolobaceae archaeon]
MSGVLLKCVNCGAPLPPPNGEYVKCEYCGYVQRVSDVRDYIERLKLEVYSWISKIIPKEYITGGTVNIDPVARRAIFESQIKPNIMSVLSSVKPKFSVLISKPLISLPKLRFTDYPKLDESKKIFEEVMKIQTVSELVVTEEDRRFLTEVISTLQIYAFLNMFPDVERKYELSSIIKILSSLIDIAKSSENKIYYFRFLGILNAYNAILNILNNDAIGAERYAEVAINSLQEAKKLSELKDPELFPTIDTEISVAESIRKIVETSRAYFEAGRQPIEFLRYIENYLEILSSIHKDKRSVISELIPLATQAAKAKMGKDNINVIFLEGDSDYLIPFWEADITYTFTTGVLFWKKGNVSQGKLLISALYPYVSTPWINVVLDKDRILDLTPIISRLSKSSVPSRYRLLPPLVGIIHAEALADNYFSRLKSSFPNIKFGASRVQRLIYVSSRLVNNMFKINNIAGIVINNQYFNKLLSIVL